MRLVENETSFNPLLEDFSWKSDPVQALFGKEGVAFQSSFRGFLLKVLRLRGMFEVLSKAPFNPLLEDFSWKNRVCIVLRWRSSFPFNPLLEDFSWKKITPRWWNVSNSRPFNPLLEDFSWKGEHGLSPTIDDPSTFNPLLEDFSWKSSA